MKHHIWTTNGRINIAIKGRNFCYPDLEAVEKLSIATMPPIEVATATAPTSEPVKKGKKITATNPVKKKKKTISSTIKKLVWNINIGEEIGKTKCLCCKSTDITQMSFNCGHVVAEANGGETIVSNLKPICQNCNSSMGTKNMYEFMLSLK
jgi:hypothetical protein